MFPSLSTPYQSVCILRYSSDTFSSVVHGIQAEVGSYMGGILSSDGPWPVRCPPQRRKNLFYFARLFNLDVFLY